MKQEDPEQFLHCSGTAVNAVAGTDDYFARGAVKMTAGIWHHTVAAAGMIGPVTVADDRMKNDSFLDGGIAERPDERRVRIEIIDPGEEWMGVLAKFPELAQSSELRLVVFFELQENLEENGDLFI